MLWFTSGHMSAAGGGGSGQVGPSSCGVRTAGWRLAACEGWEGKGGTSFSTRRARGGFPHIVFPPECKQIVSQVSVSRSINNHWEYFFSSFSSNGRVKEKNTLPFLPQIQVSGLDYRVWRQSWVEVPVAPTPWDSVRLSEPSAAVPTLHPRHFCVAVAAAGLDFASMLLSRLSAPPPASRATAVLGRPLPIHSLLRTSRGHLPWSLL